MGKRPEVDKLDYLFEQKIDFELTGSLYEEITGVALPKKNSYIKNQSALANKADKFGYEITDVQDKAIIEKIVYLKKK